MNSLFKKIREYLSSKKLDENNLRLYILIVFFLFIFVIFYHVIFAKRIIPGLQIGNVYVGGMSHSDALFTLIENEKNLPEKLVLSCEGKTFDITLEDIDLSYDWENSVIRAFEVGRTGNIITDTKDKIAGLLRSLHVDAHYDYDDDKLSTKFAQIKGEVNIEEKDAALVYEESGDITISDEVVGKKIVDDVLYSMVVNSFDRMDFSNKNIPTKIINPQIYKSNVQSSFDYTKGIVDNTMTIKGNDKQWVLNTSDLIEFVKFVNRGEETEVVLNEPKFEVFADSVSKEINTLPRGVVTTDENGNVQTFEITREGLEIDKNAFKEEFETTLFNNGSIVDLPMISVSGPATKEKYGIYELLGEGSSTFSGSAGSRIHNLTLAAERTNGVLVAPDAIYSLNDSIGDISSNTGYHTAYIIKGDRTILGAGGGVCQTSTTIFRAVLNSGLPIVMRYPHAYRVTYYEQDMPVGFDAAIFQPSWDFQFKNDTGSYVLVTTEYIPSEYKLIFRLYGTDDGREVEITEPKVTGETPPPPTLYQDDPTLAKGVVRQIDFSAWGARVSFTRTVKKDGEVLFEDVYNSFYQPWRAIYLVGTAE